MNYYIFPFDKIPKNSRIIIYAAGNIGTQYYNQVTEIAYCKVVLWLDKNANRNPVKNPMALTRLNSDDYDFAVVALYDEKAAEEAKTLLVKYGVSESKIIHSVSSFYIPDVQQTAEIYTPVSSLTADEFLSESSAVKDKLIRYFYESDGKINYFSPFIGEIKKLLLSVDSGKRNKNADSLKKITLAFSERADLSVEAKLVLLRIIFETGCFTKELMRKLVELIGAVKDNLPLKYWLLFDLSYIWFLYPDLTYDEFFTEKKKLMLDYARELKLNCNPPAYKIKNNLEICVLVINLDSSVNNPITGYVSSIVRSLNKRDYNLHVVDLAPQRNDTGAGIFNSIAAGNTVNIPNRKELLPYYPEDINIHYVLNATMKDRQQDIVDLICRINPYCILDFSDEFAPISYYYSQAFPTIYCPLRNQGYSSSFFHKYALRSHAANNPSVFPPIKAEQSLFLPLFMTIIEPKNKFYREDYGFLKSDTVVVTVGSRLQYDISIMLAKQMCDLLSENTAIKWLIIGCTSLQFITECNSDLITNGSIVFVEYEEDLPGLYGICDIYLNPKRVGGGTTIAWAMQHGLTVVSPLEAVSGIPYIGKKNSLPKEFDLVPHIKQLHNNKELLNKEKELCRSIAAAWDIEAYTGKLIDSMKKLAHDFYEKGGKTTE
jgi:hypothetical protein